MILNMNSLCFSFYISVSGFFGLSGSSTSETIGILKDFISILITCIGAGEIVFPLHWVEIDLEKSGICTHSGIGMSIVSENI